MGALGVGLGDGGMLVWVSLNKTIEIIFIFLLATPNNDDHALPRTSRFNDDVIPLGGGVFGPPQRPWKHMPPLSVFQLDWADGKWQPAPKVVLYPSAI